jgi:L,D-peptidoglycan transpeptidase YkuD (ErfK/YbiS/YcfS/YnhG family)
LRVLSLSARAREGWLAFGPYRVKCAVGRSGIKAVKREGDGATPLGRWPFREVLYRADRMNRPAALLRVRAIRPADGWCDACDDRNYNKQVRLPYPASAERLMRQDHLYDLILPLGYNDGPRGRYRGSAIFVHVARRTFGPTAGCIALRKADLERIIPKISLGAALDIRTTPRPVRYRVRRGLR